MMAIFGAILPRFTLLVAWSNDSAYWDSLFGSQLWLLGRNSSSCRGRP